MLGCRVYGVLVSILCLGYLLQSLVDHNAPRGCRLSIKQAVRAGSIY